MLDTSTISKVFLNNLLVLSNFLVKHLSSLQMELNNYHIPLHENLMKEMLYGVLDLSVAGSDGLVKRKNIPIYPKKLPSVELKGYILSLQQIPKKDPDDPKSPNRFWMDVIPFNCLPDKVRIYCLVYEEYLISFLSQAKEGALISILNLERELKDPKRPLFNTFIYRDRNFKVYDGGLQDLQVNFLQNTPNMMKKKISSSKYFTQAKPLSIEALNPYLMVRHCVKIQCKFIKIAYLKISKSQSYDELPDEARFTCFARIVASSSNRGKAFNGEIAGPETYFYVQIFDDLNMLCNLFGFDSSQKDKMMDTLREFGEF
jgi:hypothetical protein